MRYDKPYAIYVEHSKTLIISRTPSKADEIDRIHEVKNVRAAAVMARARGAQRWNF